jgi:hypothetical protein
MTEKMAIKMGRQYKENFAALVAQKGLSDEDNAKLADTGLCIIEKFCIDTLKKLKGE